MKFLHLFKVKPLLVLALFAISFQLIGQSVPAELRATQEKSSADAKQPTSTKPLTYNAEKMLCTPDTEGTPESGADCISDVTIDVNEGANSPEGCPLEVVAVGQTLSGHINTFLKGGSDNRDTDWFEFYLDGTQAVEVSVCANFDYVFFELFTPCSGVATGAVGSNTAGNVGTITYGDCTTPPAAGYYYFFVSSQNFSGIPCGTDAEYSVSIEDICGPSCTDVTASITTDVFPNETTWELTEGIGGIYYDGPYTESYTTYSEVLCLEPGCYVLDVFDSFGDGGGAVEVLIDGSSVAGGSIYGDGSAFPFCVPAGEGCVNVTINTTTDLFYTETTWKVAPDVEPTEPIDSGGELASNSTTDLDFCLDPGCYNFTIFDSFGDGISSPGGVSIVINGSEVAGGSVSGGATSFTFCISDESCDDSASAPELSACPENITECGAQYITWTAPTATDADGCAEPVVTVDPDVASGDFFGVGTTTITYTATDGVGGTDECSFTVTIDALPEVEINQSNLTEWCQGVKVLNVKIGNPGALAYPLTYAWSGGLGDAEEAVALANGSYSVIVTDANGCSTEATTVVNEDLTTLLSAHTILSNEGLEMKQSTVLSGGVGVLDADEVSVQNNSDITTFMKASNAAIDGSSTVSNYTNADSPVVLPAFNNNPYNDNNDVNVYSGGSATLSSSNYGNVKVGKNATLYIAAGTIYLKSLTVNTGSTIIFYQPTDMMVQRKLKIGILCNVNVEGPTTTIYVGDNASVGQGSNVMANIYSLEGLDVNDSGATLTTYMTGLFISNDEVGSQDNVVWNWNLTCSQEEQTPELAAQGGASQSIEDNTDKLAGLTVYPNPTAGILNIDLTDYMDQTIELTIFNALGEAVWNKQIDALETSVMKADMTRYANGIYFLNMTSNGERITKQIVLNK